MSETLAVSQTQVESAEVAPGSVEQSAPTEVVTPLATSPVEQQPGPAQKAWLENIAAEIRSDPSLQSFDSVNDLAKSFVHTKKLVGKKFLDLAPEEKKQVALELGMPKDKEGYEFKYEGNADPNMIQWFKDKAFELQLPKTAAEALFQDYVALESNRLQEWKNKQDEAFRSGQETLKKEWGPGYDKMMDAAKKAFEHYGSSELLSQLEANGMANNPLMVKAFANLGKRLMEADMVDPHNSKAFIETSEDARRAINMLEKDPEAMSARIDSRHKRHREINAELTRLYSLAYPD